MSTIILTRHPIQKLLLNPVNWITLLLFFNCGCNTNSNQKVLVIGITQTIPTLDPAMHRDRTTESVLRNIFDGLLTRDTAMRVVPELAESWRLIDDNTWEFKLRKGVLFHNGDEFTADDVKYTFDRILEPGRIDGRSSPRKGLLGTLQKVKKVDKYTVRLITSDPWPTLLAMLPFQEIVPKNYIEQVGDAYFSEHPIGAGPFRFVEWRKGEHLILEKWEKYYGGAPLVPPVSPPKIEKLIFRPIPETATRVAALKSGECSLIQLLPPHLVKNITNDPRTEVLSCSGTRSYYIGMNCTRPPFNNLLVREAMNYAIDKDIIVKKIFEGTAIILPGPLVPDAFGHNNKIPVYQQDYEKARNLLKRAGFSNGFAFELDCTQDLKEVVAAVAAQLARININAKVRVWEWGVLRSELEKIRRTCFISSWGNASLDPVGILNPTLQTHGRGNYTGYSNSTVDMLLDKAMVMMDIEQREKLYQEAEKLIHHDAPWIFGYSMKELYAARGEVKGWRPTPDGRMNMHDVELANQ